MSALGYILRNILKCICGTDKNNLFYELLFVCLFIAYRLSFYDEYMINRQAAACV